MDPVDGLPPQKGKEPREDTLSRAERWVWEGEERVARFRLRADAYEEAGHWDAAKTTRDTLLTLEATLQLMRDNLRLVRKLRGLDP
jgi:hypothetical protein